MIRTFTAVFGGGADAKTLRELSSKLDRVLANQHRQEGDMGQFEEHVANLRAEVEQTRGLMASAVKLIKGIPDIVRQAVAAAMEQNPGADLSVLDSLASDLDASGAELAAALQANDTTPTPSEPTATRESSST